MLITDKIPSCIYELMASRGVDTDKIMLATYCDMNAEHIFCDTYVIATEKQMAVISGTVGLEDLQGKRAGLQKLVRKPCLFNKLSPQFLIYICENAVGFIPTAFLRGLATVSHGGQFEPLAAVGDSPLDRLLLEEVSHQRRVGFNIK